MQRSDAKGNSYQRQEEFTDYLRGTLTVDNKSSCQVAETSRFTRNRSTRWEHPPAAGLELGMLSRPETFHLTAAPGAHFDWQCDCAKVARRTLSPSKVCVKTPFSGAVPALSERRTVASISDRRPAVRVHACPNYGGWSSVSAWSIFPKGNNIISRIGRGRKGGAVYRAHSLGARRTGNCPNVKDGPAGGGDHRPRG